MLKSSKSGGKDSGGSPPITSLVEITISGPFGPAPVASQSRPSSSAIAGVVTISAPSAPSLWQLAREPGHQVAVAAPRVEVLVERARDNLEVVVAVEVGERDRAEEAALDVVRAR